MSDACGAPEQLTLADMPRQLFACTPARLAAFDCPRRYRFTYVDRPAPPRGQPWAHTTVGAVVHLALQQWWLLPRSQRSADEGASLVERNWQPYGFRDTIQAQRACAVAADWVRAYLDHQLDLRTEPVGVERTVAMRTEHLAISGRVDRIDAREDELVVVDYKTGRRELDEDDARDSPALAMYVLAVRRTLRRACRRVELHHLPTGTVSPFEHTDTSLHRHLERAESAAHDIMAALDAMAAGTDRDEAFPPVTSTACGRCDFRQHCPEGRAASPALPAWTGLPDDLG